MTEGEKIALVDQQRLLENVSATYRRASTQDDWMRRLAVRAVDPWLRKTQSAIEVGCSDGLMTELLSKKLRHLAVVEATESFAKLVQERQLPNVDIFNLMAETYRPKSPVDCVFLTWVLTHIVDPQLLLCEIKSWLVPGGFIYVVVPNMRVLSRQLALHMGLIEDLYGLTENDCNHGHVRAYDRQRLNAELQLAGFETFSQGGLMLKPLADFQMDQLYEQRILDESHIEGLYRLGLEYPDFASAIFSIAGVKQS